MTNEETNAQPVIEGLPATDGQVPPDGDGQPERPVDEAGVAVAAALRTCFLALKFVMIALVVIYLGSGYFTLQAGQKAVVVQFGKIQGLGTTAGPVLSEGAHWSWPWPISEVKRENTEQTRTLGLDSFWFYVPPRFRGMSLNQMIEQMENGKAKPPEMMSPAIDGYLLNGEQEIVHIKCAIRYKIDDLVKYVTNVNTDLRPVMRPLESEPVYMKGEEFLIRTAAEWACTQTVADMSTDEVIRGDDARFRGQVKKLMQQRLDTLNSGIGIIEIVLDERTVPLQIRPQYLAVVQAENKKAETIANARRDATQKLYETAGPTQEELTKVIGEYEMARTLSRPQQAQADLDKIMTLLDQAGGKVANTIMTARAESSRRKEQIQAEIDRFRKTYPQYVKNPAVFMAQYWADIKQQILTSPDVERIYLPAGSKEIRLYLGHNQDFLKQSQIRKYTEQAQGQ